MQAPTKPPINFTRSLAGVLSAPLVAFAAFIAGLAAASVAMSVWNSDIVYVLCFGLAFLGGLFVTNRLCRTLARQAGYTAESVVVGALLCYAVAVVLLSFVLVGIIHDLRA